VKTDTRKALLFLMCKIYIPFTGMNVSCNCMTKKAMAKSVHCAMEYIICSLVKLCCTAQYSW
jgi:hypothetical protein